MMRETTTMPKSASPIVSPHGVEILAPGNSATLVGNLAIGVVAVVALYLGREVFVPVALAILLSFALAPSVLLLRRCYFGRVPSVIAVVVFVFGAICGLGFLLGNQLTHLAENLPQYQYNVTEKIHSLRGSAIKDGLVERTSTMLQDLSKEISKPSDEAANIDTKASRPPPSVVPPSAPAPVEIRGLNSAPLQIVQDIVGPLLQPLAIAAIVIVFLIFFLLQREDLRDRFIRLAGPRDLQRTTEALDDAGRRLSRYLLMQSAVNATFGAWIGIGLWLIGVPNPVLWGTLSAMLRFVPYIGPVIAAACPAALALAVDPGWSMLLWVLGLFLVTEPIMGQLVEPWLYGRSTGLSGVAVVVAAAFWTFLWGPVGLLLSTPLTMCLVVLGRHVERLQFLEVLLGDQPALAPEQSFYQRILADDPDEAAHQAEAFLKEQPLSAYYDQVAIKGLALAQLDVNRGTLNHEQRLRLKAAIDDVIDDLSCQEDTVAPAVREGEPGAVPMAPVLSAAELAPGWCGKPVLCVAGRGSLDEASAAMLAQLLEMHGIGARVVPREAVSARHLDQLDLAGVQMACLCYLEPGTFANARYLVRRLRRRLPKAEIIAGFWTLSAGQIEQRDALSATGVDLVVNMTQKAVEHIVDAAKESPLTRPAAIDRQTGVEISPAAVA
jgi:predicted PurR-regulated permease PerM